METKEQLKTQLTTQKIQLVKGEFTTSEASDVISALIDEKINFHKLQRLKQWEGNHKSETNQLNVRIQELQEEKRIAEEFIIAARGLGRNMTINGILEISIVDK